MLNVVGFRCAVCAATVDVATPLPWRCPRARRRRSAPRAADRAPDGAVARRRRPQPVRQLRRRAGVGRVRRSQRHDRRRQDRARPRARRRGVARSTAPGSASRRSHGPTALSDELGFSRRRRRVGQGRDRQRRREPQGAPPVHDPVAPPGRRVARARAVVVVAASSARPPLAIASCGNAALAAATLARAADVADRSVRARLGRPGRRRSPRRARRRDHDLRATRRRPARRSDHPAVP